MTFSHDMILVCSILTFGNVWPWNGQRINNYQNILKNIKISMQHCSVKHALFNITGITFYKSELTTMLECYAKIFEPYFLLVSERLDIYMFNWWPQPCINLPYCYYNHSADFQFCAFVFQIIMGGDCMFNAYDLQYHPVNVLELNTDFKGKCALGAIPADIHFS